MIILLEMHRKTFGNKHIKALCIAKMRKSDIFHPMLIEDCTNLSKFFVKIGVFFNPSPLIDFLTGIRYNKYIPEARALFA